MTADGPARRAQGRQRARDCERPSVANRGTVALVGHLRSRLVEQWSTRGTKHRYDFTDQDLGAAGPILPPGTHLIVGAGKDGVPYTFDRGNLGDKSVDQTKTALADNKPLLDPVFFTYFPGTFTFNPLVNVNDFRDGKTHHLHGSPVAWLSSAHGTMLFVWGENASLRAWALQPNGQKITFLFLAESNGEGNWNGRENDGNANQEIVEGVLRAYDATTFTGTNPNGNPQLKLLWQNTSPGKPQVRDTRFTYDKFCPPFVADGKVFLATLRRPRDYFWALTFRSSARAP